MELIWVNHAVYALQKSYVATWNSNLTFIKKSRYIGDFNPPYTSCIDIKLNGTSSMPVLGPDS